MSKRPQNSGPDLDPKQWSRIWLVILAFTALIISIRALQVDEIGVKPISAAIQRTFYSDPSQTN